MMIKKCEHCLKPYQPKIQGMYSVICQRCEPDCEKAYAKIISYIRDKGHGNVEEAAKHPQAGNCCSCQHGPIDC